jgi:threonine aldolase
LAAAGLYALDNNVERLKEDHEKAKEIGKVLSSLSFIKCVESIETNIVIFELNAGIDENTFTKKLKDKNIHIIGMGGGKLRMVTHLDYTNTMHDYVLSTFKNLKI